MNGQFPKPVEVPFDVIIKRHERLQELIKSALQGIGVRFTIILAELAGVWAFGSSALLMDALSSLVDVATSVLLVVFLRLAARPPDQNHPFGHGRFEPLMGFQLGMLMILIGGGLLFHQIFSFPSGGEPLNRYVWIIPLGAIILLEIGYQRVMRTAKQQNSPALVAEALHYRIDAITSLVALIALGIGSLFPLWSHSIDHLGGVVIAFVMVGIGFFALRQNLNQVVDRIPDEKYFDSVRAAAMRVEGVRGTEKIRIQHSGPDAHVDIDIEVDPDLSVEVAHEISQKVRVEIQKDWPMVQDVIVHIEPFYPNDH